MEYKQLGFVDKSAREAMGCVEGAYGFVRGFFPGFVVNPTEKYVGPLVVQAQGICQKALHLVDGKVDSTVHFSQDVYKSGVQFTRKVIGDEAVDQFSEAKGKYFAVVTDSWQFVRKNGVAGTASAAIKRRSEAAERFKVLVWATASAFQTLGKSLFDKTRSWTPVKKTVGYAQPYVDWGKGKYMYAHDSVVATPQYAGIYKLTLTTFYFFTSIKLVSWPVKKTKDTFYPVIEWLAEPAIQQVDPYVKSIQNHLKPSPRTSQAAPEPLPASQTGQTSNTSKASKASAPALATTPQKVE